ncbi:MAG TPA: class I SAM-dependent methyltransferase [Flavipsychrobacter sp.]|nr:class I SAM-dependent methyltransferase [Flavipsychrobacter sp.]
MTLLGKVKRRISRYLFPVKETDPEAAYDLWSQSYDAQPDNLMLALDEAVFSALIGKSSFQGKVIADVGCGTGRHWKKILEKRPSRLLGFDVSEGMLQMLKQKFLNAETYQLKDNHLPGLENNSCDIIISTLALAHIMEPQNAFMEWVRVLKPGGEIIITDYHPDALSKGGNRTFTVNGKMIAVKNYVHPISEIKRIIADLQLEILHFDERVIDDSVKHYYEKQNAMHVFERFKGTPIIYGIHLKKKDATA